MPKVNNSRVDQRFERKFRERLLEQKKRGWERIKKTQLANMHKPRFRCVRLRC